jgi:SRSO17 transposase
VAARLELRASSLRDVKGRIRRLFTQDCVAASADDFLDVLLSNEPRKAGWMRAEVADDPGPRRQQALLGRGRWDADALRDYVVEHLAADDAVIVVDETGFLKQGRTLCGVGRQYTGSAGKISNCQIGVFAAYVLRKGQAFIDRALYLPKAWPRVLAHRSRVPCSRTRRSIRSAARAFSLGARRFSPWLLARRGGHVAPLLL